MYYIIYPSEIVVFDEENERLVAVPTEGEAMEYITEVEKSMDIRRGDIVFCRLGTHEGNSIQSGDRPIVVVSNNMNNKYSNVFTGVPLTTKVKRKLPTHVLIVAEEENGLKRDSIALCEQVTVLNYGCILIEDYGKVNEEVMEQITKALQIQLGIQN